MADVLPYLPFVLIILFVYFFLLRPQIKARKGATIENVSKEQSDHERKSVSERKDFRMNEGERVIIRSKPLSVIFDKGGFFLTNQRLIKVERGLWGSSSTVRSFSLENLDSILNESSKPVGCLFIGILLVIGAIVLGILTLEELDKLRGEPTTPGILGAIAFVIAVINLITYFFGRQRLIRLTSGRSEIILNVRPLSFEKIQELVFEIEQAKQKRLERLGRDPDSKKTDSTGQLGKERKSVRQRLKELETLLREGVITKKEYDAKRKDIIGEL